MRIRRLLPALCCAMTPATLAAQTVLPAPSGDPFAPATDPLLGLAAERENGEAFRATIARAVAHSPRAAEIAAQVGEYEGQQREARAGFFPRVDLDVSAQRAISREFSNDPQNVLERSRPSRRADSTITAEQTLIDFGATISRLRASKARTGAATASATVASEDAALLAISAWYEVYFADMSAALAEALVARNSSLFEAVQARQQQGLGSRADIARVEAALLSARARGERAAKARTEARLRFLQATGEHAPARLVRSDSLPSSYPPAEESVIAAQTHSAAVAAAELRVQAAWRDVQVAEADRLPRITAGIDAGKYNLGEGVVDHDVRARLTLRYRLFNGGASEGRSDQASSRLAQSRFAANRIIEEAARDAAIAHASLISLISETELLERAYVAFRQSRDSYAEEFRVRRGTLADLLRVETDLHDAATALMRSIAQTDVARYTLLRATGGLLPNLRIEPVRAERPER